MSDGCPRCKELEAELVLAKKERRELLKTQLALAESLDIIFDLTDYKLNAIREAVEKIHAELDGAD